MPTRKDAARQPATLAEARALAHPDRLRILRLTFDASLTNKELADHLGRDPGSVHHHVRTLVATGFLRAEDPRRGARNAREVPYRSTLKSWALDVAPAGDELVHAITGALGAELLEAPADERFWTRMAVNLTPARREELEHRIEALVGEMADWPAEDGAEPWAFFVAWHARRRPGADPERGVAEATER